MRTHLDMLALLSRRLFALSNCRKNPGDPGERHMHMPRSRNHSRTRRSSTPSRSLLHDKLALRMNPSPGDAESTTFQWGCCCHSPHSERDERRYLQEKINQNSSYVDRAFNNRPLGVVKNVWWDKNTSKWAHNSNEIPTNQTIITQSDSCST